jgi:hypothetical protein
MKVKLPLRWPYNQVEKGTVICLNSLRKCKRKRKEQRIKMISKAFSKNLLKRQDLYICLKMDQ